jgi:hypothetical protein
MICMALVMGRQQQAKLPLHGLTRSSEALDHLSQNYVAGAAGCCVTCLDTAGIKPVRTLQRPAGRPVRPVKFVMAPVQHLPASREPRPSARGCRIGWRGARANGLDTNLSEPAQFSSACRTIPGQVVHSHRAEWRRHRMRNGGGTEATRATTALTGTGRHYCRVPGRPS